MYGTAHQEFKNLEQLKQSKFRNDEEITEKQYKRAWTDDHRESTNKHKISMPQDKKRTLPNQFAIEQQQEQEQISGSRKGSIPGYARRQETRGAARLRVVAHWRQDWPGEGRRCGEEEEEEKAKGIGSRVGLEFSSLSSLHARWSSSLLLSSGGRRNQRTRSETERGRAASRRLSWRSAEEVRGVKNSGCEGLAAPEY